MFQAGIIPTDTHSTPRHTLGSIIMLSTSSGTKGYIYVQASGAITGAGYTCDIDGSAFTAVMSTTTTTAPGTGAGKQVGVPLAAIANGEYGWLQVFGAGSVRVAASCAAYTLLNSTATAGTLDDDATAGAEVIDGITLDAANGGAAGNVACFINWPKVGRTL